MARGYERLDILTFGNHLLASGDLDPVYNALTSMHLAPDHLSRWLIAYWCLYHCGAASYISEQKGEKFWVALGLAAVNDDRRPTPIGGRWPRAKERRHWRGRAAVKAVAGLMERYPKKPEAMVKYIIGKGGPYAEVAARAKEHPLFGPWIAFKVCDMAERVMGVHVDFTEAAVFMFKDPMKAALMLWKQKAGLPSNAKPKNETAAIHQVVAYLEHEFREHKAPPHRDRPVGIQEIETVLCKWKSHMNGHYPLWNDVDEIREGVAPWTAHSKTAAKFLAAMPERKEL